jgi:hypothetical protein
MMLFVLFVGFCWLCCFDDDVGRVVLMMMSVVLF